MGAVVGWLVMQWSKLRGDVTTLEKAVAVMQATSAAVPGSLREIKDEIKGLRDDFKTEMRAIHERVDSKADR